MAYEYIVIPFKGQIRGSQGANDVAQQLQAVINHYAAQGWEFHTLNDVNIEVKPGCLAALLGTQSSYINYDQIIFRRPRGSA